MTSAEPTLIVDEPAGEARAVVLVLHGGRSKSERPVRATQLTVLRMLPFVHALRRADAGLVVARVRYRVRGWNGARHSPVPDAEWALDRLAARFPDLPIALVGHSMGGRTAMYVAGHERVRVVVGLAPWLEPGDPVAGLAGRRLLVVHGENDRMTSPSASAEFTRRAAGVARDASYIAVRGDSHAMLRRARLWSRLTVGFVVGALAGPAATGVLDHPVEPAGPARTDSEQNPPRDDVTDGRTADAPVPDVVARALAGRATQIV